MLRNNLGIKITTFIVVIGVFFLRPFAMGYVFTNVGLVLLTFGSICIFIINKGWKFSLYIRNRNISIYILISYSPVLFYGLFTSGLDELKSFFIMCNAIFCFTLILSYDNVMKYVFNIISYVIILLIISSIITFVLSFSQDISKLVIFKIPIRNRSDFDSLLLYYPFSPIYALFNTENFSLPRFSYFFIEAGIAAGFIVSLLFLHLNVKSNIFISYLFLIGGVITFSTSFFPALALGFIFYYLLKKKLNKKTFLNVILFSVGGYLVFRMIPVIGYDAKSQTHGSSFDDRLIALEFSLANLRRWLNIISAILLLLLLVKKKKNKLEFMACIIPIFFTGLVNVVYFSPLFIIFCYLDLNLIKRFKLIRRKEKYHFSESSYISNFQ